MEKIWLKSYQKGVPSEIEPETYTSLIDIFSKSCNQYQSREAYSNMGTPLTYQQLDELSYLFAAYLQNHCGLKKGDRYAIMLPNVLQYPIVMFAILRAGGVVVNVNPMYTSYELNYLLKDSQPKGLIVLENFASTVQRAVQNTQVEHIVVTQIGDLFSWFKKRVVNFVVKKIKKMVPDYHLPQSIRFEDAINKAKNYPFSPPKLTLDDVAFLQYTGATTGVAKGAVLTHRNMVANLMQARAWINPAIKALTTEGGIITALPLYHIFSLTANCLTFMSIGVNNILITNPRDIPGFIKELKRQPFTAITGVNTLFNALLNNENFKKIDFSNLVLALGGGMAVQKVVADKWQKATGKPLLEAYGLTEASPAVTINPLSLHGFNGAIGLPLPSTEVSIRDDDGNELTLGEPGELCIKGPQVMREYWRQPDKTKEAFTKDGWLKSGDIAIMDEEGFIKIVDRKKDLILISGFNVYPNEIEDVIAGHPKVKEVAVIGVTENTRGEMIKAFVVPNDESVTEQDIIEHCRHYLTKYKIPKMVEFRKELPKSNVGKVLRKELRNEHHATS